MLVKAVRESISDAEQRKADVEAELATLREIEELAGKLNAAGAGVPAPASTVVPAPAPAAETPRPAATRPTRPRAQKLVADPPSRPPASGSPQKTSARRAPTGPSSGASQGSAPAGGGRRSSNYDAAEVLEKARNVFARADEAISVAEVTRRLGFNEKTERALAAVRQAVLDLVGEKFIGEAGRGRGGHPKYARIRQDERAMPLPPGPTSQGSNVVDRLVDEIVEQLDLAGCRVASGDLRAKLDGDVVFEDFNLAVDRAVTLNKIAKVRAGGVTGYELVKGGAR